MTKTEDIIKLLKEGKNVEEIKTETGCSNSLISRCKTRLKINEDLDLDLDLETEPTDEEIEKTIKQIKITPEKKYTDPITKNNENQYRCMGCLHEWETNKIPKFCPNCGVAF